jgi:type IV pilus assembly protein PilC
MKKYNYRALNETGRQVRGALSAVNEIDLYQQLKAIGLEMVDCRMQKAESKGLPFLRSISARDMIQVFVHLEQLQKAGVPLMDSLSDIRDSVDSPVMRDVMTEIYREVSEGQSLSEAMAKQPKYFTHITVSITASGEETGNLAGAFAQLILFMKWSDMMRRRVVKALTYPLFTLFIFLVVLAVLMMYTVPQIVGFLRYMDQELPMVTISLIATSDFLQVNWPWVLAVPVGIIAFIKLGNRLSPGFRYRFYALCLKTPVIGNVMRKINLARFSRTFAALFKSGVDILKCMDTSTDVVRNPVMNEALRRARRQIAEGLSISGALSNTGEFPSLVIRMVKVGEDSGNLTRVFDQIAEFYDNDVDEAVQRMIGMISPTLTILLGGVILWIAAGVFGPIYGILGKLGS